MRLTASLKSIRTIVIVLMAVFATSVVFAKSAYQVVCKSHGTTGLIIGSYYNYDKARDVAKKHNKHNRGHRAFVID